MNDLLRYRHALSRYEVDEPFFKMQEQGLLSSAMSCVDDPTLERWREITAKGVLLLCENEAGDLLGCGHFTPFRGNVWEFDFTAYREAFHIAPRMAQGGFLWIFEHCGASAIVGFCAEPNRQAWHLARACGFIIMGTIPGLCWFSRRKKFVNGVMVMATPQSVEDAMAFGGSSTPEIKETPKQQVTKPVTEAATAARDDQRKRAQQAAGLNAAMLTGSPMTGQNTQKTLLGQ